MKNKVLSYITYLAVFILILISIFLIRKNSYYKKNLNSIIESNLSYALSNSREIVFILDEHPDLNISIKDYHTIVKSYSALSEKLRFLILSSKITTSPFLSDDTNIILQILNDNIDESRNLSDTIPYENIYNLKEVYRISLATKKGIENYYEPVNINNLNKLIEKIYEAYEKNKKEIE